MSECHGKRRGDAARQSNLEAALFEQLTKRRKRKESSMRNVENSTLAVVELPQQQHQSYDEKPNIRRTDDQFRVCAIFHGIAQPVEEKLRRNQMLDYVKEQYEAILR